MRGSGRTGGTRWGLAFGLSVCLVFGVVAVAVGQQPAPSGPSPAISNSDPAFRESAERDRARAEALRSPQAREERRRSRERYRGASRAEALDLAQRAFPEVTRDRLPDGRRPAPGLEVVDQFGNGAALVQDTQGGRFLLRSSDPLQVPAAGGGFTPLDMSLQPSDEGFAPAASGAPLQIGGSVGDGVELTDAGFSLVYEGREDAELVEANDRAFASEVATDTDLVVAPRPKGVEVGWIVRSPRAPQSFTLRVDMPEGAMLRRARSEDPIPGDPPEAIEVAQGDEALGYIYPPLAYDADGVPVASKADIDGDKVVVSVDHRDGDFRFPILVDPEVIVPGSFSAQWPGWTFANMAPNPREGTGASNPGNNFFGAAVNDLAYAPGLYQSMPTHTWFDNGAYAHWLYQAPANTYIYRATLGSISHYPYDYQGYRLSSWFHGLMTPPYSGWQSPVNYQDQSGGLGPNPFSSTVAATNRTHDFCFLTRCDRNKGSEQNLAVFGIQATNPFGGALYTDASKARVPMGWANIYLGDRNLPTVTQAPSSATQWVNDAGGNHQAQIKASDIGLGVKRYTLTGARDGTITGQNGCTGDVHRSACPKDPPPYTFTYRLDEGVRTMGFYAHDVVDNQSATRTWTQRIDRSAPSSVSLSGPLYEQRGEAVGEPLKLSVTASDQWSGVRKLQMRVDDQDVDAAMPGDQTLTQGDPGTGGGMSGQFDFDPSILSPGTHTVRVVATDGVGLTRNSETFEVIVDRTAPQLTTVEGSLRRPFVEGAVHDLTVEAQDPTSDGVSSGMERIEVFVRDPSGNDNSAHTAGSDGAPSLSTTFSFDATAEGYAQGRHRVRVTARDQAGNQADDVAFPVVVDREGPELTVGGSLAEREGQTVPEGQYTLDIDASDGAATNDSTQRAGVTQIDVIVNDRLLDTYQAPCPDGNCSVQRSVPFNTEDHPGGRQDIVVVAMDGLGNQTSDSLTVTTPCCLSDGQLAGFTSPLDDVAYGDVNGDAKSDVVAASPAGTLSIALSDGQVFGTAQSWGTIPAGAPLIVGDVNQDAKADIVTRISAQDSADPDRQLVQVHLSDGQQFGQAATWGEWRADADLRLADLDGDGRQDLIGRDQGTGAFRKGYSLGTTFDIGDAGVTIAPNLQWAPADPDGDQDADLLSRDPATGQIGVLASDGGLHSPSATQWGTAPGAVEVLFADMDGNNADDLVIRQPDTGRLDVGASDRQAFATLAEWGTVANDAATLALADIGGDGKADALTRNTVLGSIIVSHSNSVTPINEADPYAQDPTLEYDNTDGLLDLPGGLSSQSTGEGVPFTKIAWGSPAALVGQRGGPQGNRTFTPATAEQYNRSMWRMKQAGANVVRVIVYWGDYLNIPAYRDALDLAADRLEADNMVVYMTLTGADFDEPINGQPTHLDPDPTEFADFVTDVVNRYEDDGVRRFAMWNEPNLVSGTFLDRPRCSDRRKLTTAFLYRELYEAGYDAAKAANLSARIHIGELSEQRDIGRESCGDREPRALDADEWLDKVVGNEDIRTHGVAWHPYQHETNPRDKDKSVMGIGRIAEFKNAVDALHESGNLSTPDGKVPRTYLTEFGYFARPQSSRAQESEWHSERTRGIWSARALSEAREDPFNPSMFAFWIVPEDPPVRQEREMLKDPANLPAFDTGVIDPDTGAVTGMKGYGKGDLQRQSYCRIWWYARSNNYPQIGPQPGQPDQCG